MGLIFGQLFNYTTFFTKLQALFCRFCLIFCDFNILLIKRRLLCLQLSVLLRYLYYIPDFLGKERTIITLFWYISVIFENNTFNT